MNHYSLCIFLQITGRSSFFISDHNGQGFNGWCVRTVWLSCNCKPATRIYWSKVRTIAPPKVRWGNTSRGCIAGKWLPVHCNSPIFCSIFEMPSTSYSETWPQIRTLQTLAISLHTWAQILKGNIVFTISNIERKYFVSISIIEISYCVATSNIERKYSVHNLKYQKLRKSENMNFLWCLVRFSPACLSLRIPEEQIRICSYCLQDLVDDYRAERQYDWYLPGAARSNYIHPIVTFWCVTNHWFKILKALDAFKGWLSPVKCFEFYLLYCSTFATGTPNVLKSTCLNALMMASTQFNTLGTLMLNNTKH